jgi:hypothetical protein
MSKKSQKLSKEEELQQENNLLKAKLIAESGAVFPKDDASQLDPEIENEWLNYIYNYEQLHKDAPTVTIYEKIGKPSFKASHELDENQLSAELTILLDCMLKNSIELTCLCEYDDRVIYDFITEELFLYELQDMNMKGFFTCFTYEEFHPNHDYDLRRQAEDFITALLDKEWHEMDGTFINPVLINVTGEVISKSDFIRNIQIFQNSHHAFDIKEQEITNAWFDLEKGEATVDLDLSYDAVLQKEKRSFSGKTRLSFLLEDGYWNINQALVPGFNK